MTAALSGLGGRLVTLLAPFIATPALLNYVGDHDFGLWATAVSITTIAVVADLGVGSGLLTRVSSAHGRNDSITIRSYISSAAIMILFIAAFMFIIVGLLFWALDLSPVVMSVILTFIVGMPATLFFQFLIAVQRVPLASLLQIFGATLAVCFSLGSISLELPAWAVALAYAAPPVIVTYLSALIYFIHKPHYRPALKLIKLDLGNDLLRLGWRFFLLSVLTAASVNLDNFIIAVMVGPDAVAAYSIPMRLGSLLTLIIVALTMPMWGANGEALAKGEYDWVKKNAYHTSLFCAAIVTTAGFVLFLKTDWIIDLWIGRSFDNQKLVVLGFAAMSIATAITSPYNMVLNALGKVYVQIFAWSAFILSSIIIKLCFVNLAIWALPLIGAAAYTLIILPSIIFVARTSLNKE